MFTGQWQQKLHCPFTLFTWMQRSITYKGLRYNFFAGRRIVKLNVLKIRKKLYSVSQSRQHECFRKTLRRWTADCSVQQRVIWLYSLSLCLLLKMVLDCPAGRRLLRASRHVFLTAWMPNSLVSRPNASGHEIIWIVSQQYLRAEESPFKFNWRLPTTCIN